MAPVDPFEMDEGTVQVEPDGEQVVNVEFRLTVLPVEFVRLNVIVSAACAAAARPSAANSAATIKPVFFIINPNSEKFHADQPYHGTFATQGCALCIQRIFAQTSDPSS